MRYVLPGAAVAIVLLFAVGYLVTDGDIIATAVGGTIGTVAAVFAWMIAIMGVSAMQEGSYGQSRSRLVDFAGMALVWVVIPLSVGALVSAATAILLSKFI